MKLYYMELTSTSANIYTCELHDRHKIWVAHPDAKEISKKEYWVMRELLMSKETTPCTPLIAKNVAENIKTERKQVSIAVWSAGLFRQAKIWWGKLWGG